MYTVYYCSKCSEEFYTAQDCKNHESKCNIYIKDYVHKDTLKSLIIEFNNYIEMHKVNLKIHKDKENSYKEEGYEILINSLIKQNELFINKLNEICKK